MCLLGAPKYLTTIKQAACPRLPCLADYGECQIWRVPKYSDISVNAASHLNVTVSIHLLFSKNGKIWVSPPRDIYNI